MTEYELVDALNSTVDLMINTFSTYVAITSAYLVGAFLAGARLTRWQCTVISVLYTTSAGVAVFSLFFMGGNAVDLVNQLSRVDPGKAYGMQSLARAALTLVCAGGIPACLKFMWDIRRAQGQLHAVASELPSQG